MNTHTEYNALQESRLVNNVDGEADTGVASTGLPSQGHSPAGEVRESVRRDSAEPEGNGDTEEETDVAL